MKVSPAPFKGRRVLVTGHTGFKGSWLSLWLHLLGARVAGFALPPEHPDAHFNLLGLKRRILHVEGDLRDPGALRNLCRRFRPEIVFHLAAQPLVRVSYAEPKRTLDTNVGGSANVLEAVRTSPSVKALVYVTSDKCYLNKERRAGYRENDELGGHDPYSASKAAAELIFRAYWESFFKHRKNLGAASARAGNVIGGGDWSADRIVPDSIRALLARRPIPVRNPASVRPWQHVLEPLSGYLTLAGKLLEDPRRYSGSWNFGPGESSLCTVGELVRKIIACWGSGRMLVKRRRKAPDEAGLLVLNCRKANRVLGWRPRWKLDRGVEETVRWYKGIAGDREAWDLATLQIQAHMESA